jgi:hypothetical protein
MSTFNPSPSIGYQFGTSGMSTSTASTGSTSSGFSNFFKSDVGKQTLSQGIGALFNFAGLL